MDPHSQQRGIVESAGLNVVMRNCQSEVATRNVVWTMSVYRDISYSNMPYSTSLRKYCLTKLYEIYFLHVLFNESLHIKWQFLLDNMLMNGRTHWPSGLRRGSAAARLLRLLARIPLGTWMFVSCECCVSSVRNICDELIARPEESCRLWCIVVCDLETSIIRSPRPAIGRSATEKKCGYEC